MTSIPFRLIATSDLHAFLFPFDYYRDAPINNGGLIRTASLIREAQREVGASLLVDNGDLIQGGPLGEIVQDEATHPMIAALSALGCAAINLGNHDLDFGIDTIEHLQKPDSPAFLCANICLIKADGRTGPSLGRRHHIVTRVMAPGAPALRIGLVGVMPPRVISWAANELGGRYRALPMIATVAREAAALREAGVDLVIALAHSGLELIPGTSPEDNLAGEIAALPDVDAVVAGHTHMSFPNPSVTGPEIDTDRGTVYGTPLVQPGVWGRHIGVIDFDMQRQGAGWKPVRSRAGLRSIVRPDGSAAVADDPELRRRFESYHKRSREVMAKPLGETQIALYSYLTLLGIDPSLRLISEAHKHAIRPLLTGPAASQPLLAAVAPFRGGAPGADDMFVDVPAGPVHLRHVFDLYIYPNRLLALDVSGAELAEWLEASSGAYKTVLPGERDRYALRSDRPLYDFDVIPDLYFRIDLSHPPGQGGEIRRIKDLTYQGVAVDPDARFTLITNDFRRNGGGGFFAATQARAVLQTRIAGRDAVADYISSHSPIHVSNSPLFEFAPISGASLLFPCKSMHVASLATSMLSTCEIVCTPDDWLGVRMRL